ncbi:hypothetical protein [Embleya sp. NPDC005971]|uniref:hypothetical protein n=1 Tax=unclassified Embleya TaxID=2699296 RepID=UPI0033FB038D
MSTKVFPLSHVLMGESTSSARWLRGRVHDLGHPGEVGQVLPGAVFLKFIAFPEIGCCDVQ